MDDPSNRRPSPVRTGIGCVFGALTAVALALTGFAFLAYLFARDLDLDLDLDFDLDGLSSPSAEWVSGIDVATGERQWAQAFGAGTEPVGISSDVLVLRRAQGLVAVDVATGERRWQRDISPSARGVGLTGGAVVFLDGRGSLVGVDAVTGTERWRAGDAATRGDFVTTGAEVVIVATGGEVRAIDAATGSIRWVATVGLADRVLRGTVIGDLFVLRTDSTAMALEVSTGAVRWTWAPPAGAEGIAALLGYLDAPIGAGPTIGLQIVDSPVTGSPPTTSTVFVAALTGEERWRTPSGALSSFAFDPVVAGGTLFENGEGGRLRARDPLTGTVRFEVDMISGAVLAAGGSVFVADGDAVAVDSNTGAARWSRNLGADRDATPLGAVGGVLVVAGKQVRET